MFGFIKKIKQRNKMYASLYEDFDIASCNYDFNKQIECDTIAIHERMEREESMIVPQIRPDLIAEREAYYKNVGMLLEEQYEQIRNGKYFEQQLIPEIKIQTPVLDNDIYIDPLLKSFIFRNGFCMDEWQRNFDVFGWKKERAFPIFKSGGYHYAYIDPAIIRDNGLIINQSLEHYSSVIQITAYLIQNDVKDVKINHVNGPDVQFTHNNVSYAIEYERQSTHCKSEIIDKLHTASKSFDKVYFICVAKYKKDLVRYLGEDIVFSKGQELKEFIDSIL